MNKRVIKDTIHGYIYIEDDFSVLVDSAEFNRLKQVDQGSFRVLYPAARHDRYIHSLGTYHLAQCFSEYLINNIEEDIEDFSSDSINDLLMIQHTFHLASLMHDIGHAPFSHTSELFFADYKTMNYSKKLRPLKKELIDVVENNCYINPNILKEFKEDIESCECNPHELMSAIIMIKTVKKYLDEDSLEKYDLPLAVRMIIGCPFDYEGKPKNKLDELGLKNCFIRLLNSSIIDVDKLDYLTRDLLMSGFEGVNIDIQRLSMSVSAIRDKNGHLYPAYRKRALSVIDNVFRAKSQQILWFFNHPVVVYDSNLIRCCIAYLDGVKENYIDEIFTSQALSEEGIIYGEKQYCLLSDLDILKDIKSEIPTSRLSRQFFNLESRYAAIWCSYYEFIHFFNGTTKREKEVKNKRVGKKVYKYLKPLLDYLDKNYIFFVNQDLLNQVKDSGHEDVLMILESLKEIFDSGKEEFEFVLLKAKHQSNVRIDKEKIKIIFKNYGIENLSPYLNYSEINFNENNDTQHDYFYIYTKEGWGKNFYKLFRKKLVKLSGYRQSNL